MDKLIILGLIGYIIWSNLPNPNTEPPLQTVTDRENVNPATTQPPPANQQRTNFAEKLDDNPLQSWGKIPRESFIENPNDIDFWNEKTEWNFF